MVLFQIERSVGALVTSLTSDGIDLPERQAGTIKARGASRLPASIVEESYLGEVLDLAVSATADQSQHESTKRLRTLYRVLGLFEIRNAIAHPNRPFPAYYWHRMSTVATDPCITSLGFDEVATSFRLALEGEIKEPPEEWMNGPAWSLPNNLPEVFEHAITGLIGRSKEKDKVIRLISNPRIRYLAIVARGGVGKTSLALETLNDIVINHESKGWTDRILYVSSKTERLTTSGIAPVQGGAETIDDLKEAVIKQIDPDASDIEASWSRVCKNETGERVLLCLDNVETLLRESPDSFSEFYYELPGSWKVLVTSRIPVDGAHTVSLSALEPSGAKKFANMYANRRGYKDINQKDIDNVLQSTDYNPLAIRLSIDTLISGGSLSEAISQTTEDVVEYSYKNLVNALSDDAKKVLECLFVIGQPIGRSEIIRLINIDLDSVSYAISEIYKTSLCTRLPDDSVEKYKLGSSVRQLLLIQPADEDARKEIQSELRNVKLTELGDRIYKENNEVSPLSPLYVPFDLVPAVRDVAVRAVKIVFKEEYSKKNAFRLLQLLKDFINSGTDSSSLFRIVGMLYIRLMDRENGKRWLQKAVNHEMSDPAASMYLSRICRQDNDLDMAISVAKPLFDNGWHLKDEALEDGNEVVRNYFLPLIWNEEYDYVAEQTEDWKEDMNLSEVKGTLRMDALRRKAVKVYRKKNINSYLIECINIATHLLRTHGYSGYIVDASIKNYDEFCKIMDQGYKFNKKSIYSLSHFTDQHFINVCQSHRSISLDSEKSQHWIRNIFVEAKDAGIQILDTPHWESYVSKGTYDDESDKDMTEAHIYSIPCLPNGKRRTYLFARDAEDRSFFVHYEVLGLSRREWNDIEVGDKIGVVEYDTPNSADKSLTVRRAYFFESAGND
jgi:hypothetical protein